MSKPLNILTIGHSHIVDTNRAMWRTLAENPEFIITVAAPKFFQGDLRPLSIDPEPPGSRLALVPLDAHGTGWIHGFHYDDAQLRRLMREGNFDVVHAWEEPYIYAGYQIARSLQGLPSRFAFRTAQNLFKRYPPPFSYFERVTLGRAQAWIAGGDLVFETMLRRGYPMERGRVLSLAVDLQAFHPLLNIEKRVILGEMGLKPPILGFVGRLSREKGLNVLMKAVELLPRDMPWSVLLLGSGPYKRKLRAWAKSRGLGERVRIHLALHHDVPRYLASMDILLAPSQTTWHWREQFGRMIVEAFACGVPVIGSDSGEIPFVIDEAGLVVPENDPAAWTSAIRELLASPEDRAGLARLGLERVHKYSNITVAAQFAEFYRGLSEQRVTTTCAPVHRTASRVSAPKPVVNGGEAVRPSAALVSTKARRLISIAHSYCVALNRRLAHEMAQSGRGKWEVTAVSPSFFYGDLRPVAMEPTKGEACSVEEVEAYLTRHIHFMYYGRDLREILRRGWDLVHCWEEPYVFSGGQIAMWTPNSCPIIFWTCQNINKYYPPPFCWIEDYCFQKCAGWTALGETVEATMLARGYGKKPHSIMPLGVEPDQFYPDPRARQQVLQKLGWADTPNIPVVGFLGRFVPEKGLDLLMRTLGAVRSPWRALFIGSGPMQRRLQEWSDRFPGRVRLLTNVRHDEVPAHLNAMDLLCAPSQTTSHWREQFGRMVIEAFACGVPVIASDSGEIPHVVGNAGLIVSENDDEAWIQAIEGLLSDPMRRNDLSMRGLDRVQACYTWKVIAQKHLNFFEEVLDGSR
jgi:glycosyltransferase involved in cell wall biosynthesis